LLLTGPLADGVFEPAMQQGGLLAGSVGQIIGVGPGRGLALFIMVLGLLSAMLSAVAYAYPRIRYVEDELSDADGARQVDVVEVVQTAL
jgi:DHA3 family macrolide efflux protein-like MFS transporter